MNGLQTKADMDAIPLGSYYILIGMDWLDLRYAVLDCHNKTITCLDDDNKHTLVKGFPRLIYVLHVSAMQIK